MELTLDIVVIKQRPGHWQASIPWAKPLAEPSTAGHRTAVVEDIIHRAASGIGQSIAADWLDTLLSPDALFSTQIEIQIEREVEPDRPPERIGATIPFVAGSDDDGLCRAWLPTARGECVAAPEFYELYQAVSARIEEWADERDASNLEELEGGEYIDIVSVDIDILLDESTDGEQVAAGRLERPDALHDVATNLTHLAAEGTAERAFGRDDLADELVDAITSEEASHVCLVGPPGCGKTAIIEEAVQRAYDLQSSYQQRRDVWRTTGDQMVAGMSFVGQWQERATRVCRELAGRGDVLVIDDMLGFAQAGPGDGQSNLARFFEPELTRGRFSVLSEATSRTIDLARRGDPGFVEKFRRIHVPPMDVRETYGAANAFVRELEADIDVAFSPDAIESAVELCDRYFRGEVFPGKAIRLLRTCAREAERESTERTHTYEVDPDFVAEVIHRETGLPRRILVPGEGRTAEEARSSFEERVFGQREASRVVSQLISAVEQGFCNPERPFASLLLIGPSGVGKTETAKTLAEEIFGSVSRLTRFDMSEFAEPGAASRLIGTRQSPEGELTSRVRTQPYTVLLFDEIEKAHRDVLDLLLQILDEGRLTDAAGRTVDFCNTLVAMTSNLGADTEVRDTGFKRDDETDADHHYRRAAEDFFRPEFFNRIDRVVPYRPLDRDALRRIARRALGDVLDRRGLRQPGIMIDVSPELVEHLVKGAADRRYGARTLKQRIERRLLTPLARQMTRYEESPNLTRVRIVPGDQREIGLEMETLEPADPIDTESASGGTSADLRSRIDNLFDDVLELRDSDAMASVDERHAELLDAFNETSNADGMPADDSAESLRQLEIVRQQFDDLVRRLRGLFGEESPDEPELPEIDEFDRTRRHKWMGILDDLRAHFTWASRQLDAVRGGEVDAGTLVVRGLSGPTGELLEIWTGIVTAFADAWDIETSLAVERNGRWHPVDAIDGGFESIIERLFGGDQPPDAVAISAEHPGIRLALRQLAGYVWAPKPPTHGRHALIRALPDDWGTVQADELAEHLSSRPPSEDESTTMEFRLEDGQLHDLRLARKYKCPDRRGEAFQDFASEVLLERMRLLGESVGR